MKSLRSILPIVLLSFSAVVFAQSEMHQPTDKLVLSDAQKSFTQLKTLAGTWQGSVTVDPPLPEMGNNPLIQVSLRVTSRGNALVHEMHEPGKPDDPARYDHPVTMFYVESNQLNLVHYCDAGNRPRMTGTISPDGKSVEFEFASLSGGNEHGHMYHAVFTIIDANHHIEDWTYMMPGDKPVHARMDLKRAQ